MKISFGGAGVFVALIDSDEEAAGYGDGEIFGEAERERLSGVA